jgi:hypothetical protein
MTHIAALTLIVFLSAQDVFAADRILVAGTKSEELSVIDERLIREETMRLLFEGGHSIIPVMELERETRERNTTLALLGEREFFTIAEALNVRWIIHGTLASHNRTRVYTLDIYDTGSNKKYTTQILIPDGDFPGLCTEIAKRVAEKVTGFIHGPETPKKQ